jgi:predicted nucleic acid-binding protein
MPINLTIQAEVIDLRHDTPQPDDIFLVDTNVWLWQTYINAIASSRNAPKKIKAYTPYLRKARTNGAMLVYSGLILAELAHVIEKTELSIYNQRTGSHLDAKEYRHSYPTERAKVAAEVDAAWHQVEAIAASIDLTVNDATTNAALARFRKQALDGYDLLMLEAMSQSGVKPIKVITDDMDYAVAPGIQVFTNNGLVIQQARQQNKLLVR